MPSDPPVSIGFKTSPQGVDWETLDATWARAGEIEAFDSGWMNDHLTDPTLDRHGASWEAVTALSALVHHVPGLTVGHGVLSNTFRHPAVLAKQATVLDHATGGHFVLGLGAGWHEGEHVPFGIPLPPIRERFDRFESAVQTIKALFAEEAGHEPGVSRQDSYYPLAGATNQPPPLTQGGPPMWLGGQKRRGLALVAARGDGWMLPALPEFDIDYFREKREGILAAMSTVGRDPGGFAFAAQVATGTTADSRRASLDNSLAFARAGATHIILGMPARLGPEGLTAVAREVAQPLREALG
jgi:alkanesulfonate monooxygenase SsuD/methylene tetrahydromethanopterin reductase-like flavin-dependent oxidoreductase (luciferase family)